MATISSSSSPVSSVVNPPQKNGVFLSFSGKDIRFSFLSHLEEALCQQGIPAFIKSEESDMTDDEETKISTVIQQSNVSVVIFSENYASFPGCLNEVAKIMDCNQKLGQQVLPVFFHVDPEDVGGQSGIYEKAIAGVAMKFKISTDVVLSWRNALEQATKLPGLVLCGQKSLCIEEDREQYQLSFTKFESDLVRKIVEIVSKKLGYRYSDELKNPDELQAQIQHIRRDRVFLSFRGADTRNNFVSHVYSALCLQGIPTFIDSDQSLRGRKIATILTEIEESNVSIPVLSPDFASSSWCLEELAKIIECMRTKKQLVLPVFYHVDPDDVANQTGCFKKAFDEHEKNYKDNKSLVKKWRDAMTAVANVSGWVIGSNSPESEVVKRISEIIVSHLHYIYDDLVGGHPRVHQIEMVSCFEQPDIRIIGIRGDSGTGKTSLAGHLFSRFSINFETSIFLTKVTEEMMRRNGPSRLQGKLLSGTIDQDRPKKVLIVLDDINRFEDFIRLVGRRNQFGAGSRIIVTSTDKDLLDCIVDYGCMHEVSVLSSYEIFELFSLFAFEGDLRKQPRYLDLMHEVVNLIQGNPLAIKVLGLFLYGKSLQDWEAAVKKLKTTPDVGKIQEMLRLSIDALKYDERQIFLDIACFFNGKPKSHITRILDAYGYDSTSGLQILTQRFLITVDSSMVYMFAMIEEMGKKIVREECEAEPGKRSRLWDPNEISQVLQENKGTEKVEGISLDMSKIEELYLDSTVLQKMNRLTLLSFYESDTDKAKMHLPRGLKNIPSGLRYLQWNHYPLESLPSSFSPEMLVELDMSCSKVVRLWNGVQVLPNLYSLCLRNCNELTEIPNLSKASSLEILDCEGCEKLEVVSRSIRYCTKLAQLILRRCSRITRIPSTQCLWAFKTLDLRGCSALTKFPQVSEGTKKLLMSGTAIQEVPALINYLHTFERLDLSNCTELRSLSLGAFGSMTSLQTLDLSGSIYLTSIPKSIKQLPRLRRLNIRGCKKLDTLPKLPGSLTYLDAEECSSLRAVEGFDPIEKYGACFNFTNCLSLNTESRRKILDHAKQCLAAKCPEKDEIQRVVFSVPREDIPEWITSKCIGSSITKTLPKNWFTDKFLGFALCAVLGPQDTSSGVRYDRLDSITWKVQFKPDIGVRSCMNEKVEDNELHKSAHLYLFSSKQFDGEANNDYNEATFDVSASVSEEKKIGVQLLYASLRQYPQNEMVMKNPAKP